MVSKSSLGELKTSDISKKDREKIMRDLRFVDLINGFAKSAGMRVVVSGGYATDGNLGKLTRPHNDIDIQVYGKKENAASVVNDLIEKIVSEDKTFTGLEIKDKGRGTFYHSFFIDKKGFGADIYYIQVVDSPFNKTKKVIKDDGSKSDPHLFNTNNVELDGVNFEAEKPIECLVDILYKRKRGDKTKPEHDQDIYNLRLITDSKEVKKRLLNLGK